MALSVRLDAGSVKVSVLLRKYQSPAERSAMVANAARDAIAAATVKDAAALGAPPSVDVFVDGRLGASIDSVRPDGTIVAEFDLLNPLLAYLGEQLVQHSPVKTGQFERSILFLADGVEIAAGARVPVAEEFVFVAAVPYARKIERGLSQQAPDGVFQVVAALASRRFGNIAQIKFGYRPVSSGAVDKWASGTAMASHRRGAKRDEWLRRQPAIIITPR